MKSIVITGPEASGKSHLTKFLAQQFQGDKVMEYARWYLPTLPRQYIFNDLLAICRGQERNYIRKRYRQPLNDWLFIDTWAIVLMIWSEFKYGRTHPAFELMLQRHEHKHYLLCAPDLPWEDDPLREHPHDREELFNLYRDKLDYYNLSYSIIQGDHEDREQKAIKIIKAIN